MDIVRTLKLLILCIMIIAVTFTLIIQLPKTYIKHLSYQEYKENVKRERARNLAVIEAYNNLPPLEFPSLQVTAQQQRAQQKLEIIRQQMIRDKTAELVALRKKAAELQEYLEGSDARIEAIRRRFEETGSSNFPRYKPSPLYSKKRAQETYRCTTAGGSTVYQETPCDAPQQGIK